MDQTRRQLLAAACAAPAAVLGSKLGDRPAGPFSPSLPALGVGSWITFDVGTDEPARARCAEVLRVFLDRGGRLIDSSPMYGSSPDVIGASLARLDARDLIRAASKVWIPGRQRGKAQMSESLRRWGIEKFWLMQVHNLVDWRAHLPTLREMRDLGALSAIGVTTSHGRRHAELLRIMVSEPLDTVQLTYNIGEREAEARLLPTALDRGISVIVNRPFATGGLFRAVAGRSLPPWASDLGISSWSQFFLKFVIAHPAVTCAIPATSSPAHMAQNMGALEGPLPNASERAAMVAWFEDVRR